MAVAELFIGWLLGVIEGRDRADADAIFRHDTPLSEYFSDLFLMVCENRRLRQATPEIIKFQKGVVGLPAAYFSA
jgi:hypothetical protein